MLTVVETDISNGGEKTILAMAGCKSMATAQMVTTGMSVNKWTLTTTQFLLAGMTGRLVIPRRSGGLQPYPEGVMSWVMDWTPSDSSDDTNSIIHQRHHLNK